ncbi:hypothetical protein [Melaminivora jejuensis]|nr:hypothetical protein [Melaminivora jejuensis]
MATCCKMLSSGGATAEVLEVLEEMLAVAVAGDVAAGMGCS